jgi:hypothetical protein
MLIRSGGRFNLILLFHALCFSSKLEFDNENTVQIKFTTGTKMKQDIRFSLFR